MKTINDEHGKETRGFARIVDEHKLTKPFSGQNAVPVRMAEELARLRAQNAELLEALRRLVHVFPDCSHMTRKERDEVNSAYNEAFSAISRAESIAKPPETR